jgi:hypothetical protein
MTKTAKPRMIQRGKMYIRNMQNGTRLEGEVSLCVFMYPGYPLQVQATLTGNAGEALGNAHTVNRKLNATTATEIDVAKLFAIIQTKPCSRCGTPAFDSMTVETNRDGLCEPCFVGDLEVEFAKEAEAELRKLAWRDQRWKAKGMKFRVTAWIHPDAGDDYQVDWYFPARPLEAQIQALLRKQGSTRHRFSR